MDIEYHGPHSEGVEVPRVGVVAKHGERVTVPDSVGESLIEQEAWRKAGESEEGAAKRREGLPADAPQSDPVTGEPLAVPEKAPAKKGGK
jgi:hypothetical protein